MSYGGTPHCARCDKAVYAAEQVIGPGRKIYHKPCLKCTTCSKRLDSFSLVEHNFEPYCKSCHVKNFGTRDLRSANLTTTPTTPKRKPTALLPEDDTPPVPAFDALDFKPFSLPTEADSPAQESTSPVQEDASTDTLPPMPPIPVAPAPRWLQQSLTGNLPPAAPLRATATGSPSKVQRFTSPGRGSRAGLGAPGNPLCPVCDRAVYFAEQVKASGRVWHKTCLRCTNCAQLLDSTRLTEKDGDPLCRSCYSKLHGPQGSGYALLGR